MLPLNNRVELEIPFIALNNEPDPAIGIEINPNPPGPIELQAALQLINHLEMVNERRNFRAGAILTICGLLLGGLSIWYPRDEDSTGSALLGFNAASTTFIGIYLLCGRRVC